MECLYSRGLHCTNITIVKVVSLIKAYYTGLYWSRILSLPILLVLFINVTVIATCRDRSENLVVVVGGRVLNPTMAENQPCLQVAYLRDLNASHS